MAVIIARRFPDFYKKIASLPDNRKRPQYSVKALIVSGLLIFLFKQQSRNKADTAAKNLDYRDNIKALFGIRPADNDTVDRYLRFLNPDKLEVLKKDMFRALVKSKALQKHKFLNQYFMIAVDGTGMQSFDYEPYPGCTYKEYKNGRRVWTTYVLEAKVVTASGFALSLATEWIENPTDNKFEKQDIEIKAFKRLARKLKKDFPRLPVLLLLDGLYPNDPVFSLCENYRWKYSITLKDKSLKSVWEEINDRILFKEYQTSQYKNANRQYLFSEDYKIHKDINYKSHIVNVLETDYKKTHRKSRASEQTRFVHITNINLTESEARKISNGGRLRWKIENEGFNNQKNNGYNLSHKFSRTNFNAAKNYYELLQIADIINQLAYKTRKAREFMTNIDAGENAFTELLLNLLKFVELTDTRQIKEIIIKTKQLRY